MQSQIGLVQCQRGFIWVAGEENLWRYDGHTFQLVAPDTSGDPIPRSCLQKGMTGGRHGILGVYGSSHEFVLYDVTKNRATVVALPPPKHQPDDPSRISCATEDPLGRFLIGTWEGEVYRLDPKSLRPERIYEAGAATAQKSRTAVTDVLVDSSGALWVGTSRGLMHFGAGTQKWEEYTTRSGPPKELPSEYVAGIALGQGRKIWVLMRNGRFGWIDLVTGVFTACRPVNEYDRSPIVGHYGPQKPICADLEGNVWVRGVSGGILRWDTKTELWDAHLRSVGDPQHPGGVATNFTTLDNSGNLWVGTNGDGLFRYAPSASRFQSCTPGTRDLSGLSSPNVLSMWKDREGVLWVGTVADGVNYLPPGSERFLRLRHNPSDASGLPSSMVTCIRDRNRDEIWLGMVGGGGICVYDKRTRQFTRSTRQGLKLRNLGSDTVTAMHQDRYGTMWVGHYRGLDRYDDSEGTFRPVIRWSRETLGRTGSIAYMTEDDKDNLWIAVLQRGLGRVSMHTDHVTWYRNDPGDPGSLPSNSLWCVFFDRTRRVIWVPAPGRAIARHDEAAGFFVRHQISPSLPADSVFKTTGRSPREEPAPTGITADTAGNLWISVGHNIIKFNPDKGISRSYGRSDGIAVAETRRNAFFRSDDGTIYFGGSGGLTWFHPDRMPENAVVPPVVLTGFAVLGISEPVPPAGIQPIRLRHDQHTFSFEFAALEFTNPEQNQFMYKLKGGGDTWEYLGTERKIRFVNVSPGEYLLRVRASNNDGVWNNEGISIPLTISSPYWATYWFRALVIALVLGALAVMYRRRLSRMRMMEQLRMRIADDLHDDIGSELSAIALESDLLARRLDSAPEHRRRAHEVGRAVRSAGEKLRDVVWIINPDQEKLGDLVARMKNLARTMLAGIEVSSTVRNIPHSVPLSMEFKRNTLLMFKEILHNIVRHAKAKRVTILIDGSGGVMQICVQDDGTGFDPSSETDGRGLKSIRARADEVRGAVTIESAPGSGTRINFSGRITHS